MYVYIRMHICVYVFICIHIGPQPLSKLPWFGSAEAEACPERPMHRARHIKLTPEEVPGAQYISGNS